MRHSYKAAEIQIASTETRSDVVPAENLRFAGKIAIEPPDTLTGAVVKPQIREEGDSDWDDIERGDGTVVELTAGQVSQFIIPEGMELSILSDSAEAADRAFSIIGTENLR